MAASACAQGIYVAKSQDLTAAVSLLAALLALRYFGPGMLEDMVGATRFFLSGATDLAPQTESATAITADSTHAHLAMRHSPMPAST